MWDIVCSDGNLEVIEEKNENEPLEIIDLTINSILGYYNC